MRGLQMIAHARHALPSRLQLGDQPADLVRPPARPLLDHRAFQPARGAAKLATGLREHDWLGHPSLPVFLLCSFYGEAGA